MAHIYDIVRYPCHCRPPPVYFIGLSYDVIYPPPLLSNFSADEQEKTHEELLVIYNDGVVRWIPPAIYKSSCSIDMRNFPFDEQSCHLKYGSWTYDGNKLELAFYDELVDFDTREYIDSSEWTIVRTAAEHNVRLYPCCEDEPYPDITFYLTIKRRTAFYIYVLILPSVLLSFLTLVLFWIPPQRPDRTSLGQYGLQQNYSIKDCVNISLSPFHMQYDIHIITNSRQFTYYLCCSPFRDEFVLQFLCSLAHSGTVVAPNVGINITAG